MNGKEADLVADYLRTGDHDVLASGWPGGSIIERCRGANDAMKGALVSEVIRRTQGRRAPRGLSNADLEGMTRAKVRPMVDGLFAPEERAVVMDTLARSVVFLTPANVEGVLRAERYLHTAWNLANLYLLSCDAELL